MWNPTNMHRKSSLSPLRIVKNKKKLGLPSTIRKSRVVEVSYFIQYQKICFRLIKVLYVSMNSSIFSYVYRKSPCEKLISENSALIKYKPFTLFSSKLCCCNRIPFHVLCILDSFHCISEHGQFHSKFC